MTELERLRAALALIDQLAAAIEDIALYDYQRKIVEHATQEIRTLIRAELAPIEHALRDALHS